MVSLKVPTIDDQIKYIEVLQEWIKDGSYRCPDILEEDVKNATDYQKLLERIQNTKKGIHNDLDWYQFGHYFIIQDNEELIGAVAIRENLTELGDRIWGNIALGIRPSKRCQGYAKKSLQLAIQKCRELGMNRVTACHYIENKISPKLITACGGVYEETVISEYSGKEIKRYHF